MQGCRVGGWLLCGLVLLAGQWACADEIPCASSEISSVRLVPETEGGYQVEVDYCFRPEGKEPVFLYLVLDSAPESEDRVHSLTHEVLPGKNSARIELNRPMEPKGAFSTNGLAVQLSEGPKVLLREHRELRIDWPAMHVYQQRRFYAQRSNDELLLLATEKIDEGTQQSFGVARQYLEKLIVDDPESSDIYVQLARLSLNEKAGVVGFSEAERYLESALQFNKKNTSALILLGRVLTNQQRYDEARSVFEKTAGIGTESLWLWVNWGSLYLAQGREDDAIAMYRKATAGTRPNNRNDRARLDAYNRLMLLFTQKQLLDEVEALHLQRTSEFDIYACYFNEYAEFRLNLRADYQGAIDLGHKALEGGCTQPAARETLGLAYYLHAAEKKTENSSEVARAKVYFPEGARLYYRLAKLGNNGLAYELLEGYREKLDVRDQNGFSAIAYSLGERSLPAARRLHAVGASLTQSVGPQDYPLAMLPVFYDYAEGVEFLIERGVDYSTMEYAGVSAIEYALRQQDPHIAQLIRNSRKT